MEFQGSNCLRQRLVLSVLTGKAVKITGIRDKQQDSVGNYGLNESEMNLLKLMEKVTNGSDIYVDQRGTRLDFRPGLPYGGRVEHDCSLGRSIGYYLEPLLMLAPFCKHPLEARLTGITNDRIDPSVDSLKHSSLAIIKQFLGGAADDDELSITVESRGLAPAGGGCIVFKCPIRRYLRPIQSLDAGKVRRIRGLAYATRVSPQLANRMVAEAKGILLKYIPDIYIYTDHLKGPRSGKSRGFGLCLWAETTVPNGCCYVGDACSHPSGSGKETEAVAEDIAREATYALLNDIYRGGAVDTQSQPLCTLFMAFGQRDLSKVLLGPLSPFSIQLFRHMKQFVDLTFKLDTQSTASSSTTAASATNDDDMIDDELRLGSTKLLATCVGIGYTNLNKTVS
ncbi:RNA 3'-terminal phosphate cyclase-like protein [Oppia nitens]|uniref:RNA 3'-terminal phosphate cyclase-like protein n=1 Tax=Oppia nitens TaxID=1686743 RepID=UPI0023DA77C2|nr:RNA 3'-terminal phosphate cyclase-like protein [Oppia nitens]